jgi:hypothetical protein
MEGPPLRIPRRARMGSWGRGSSTISRPSTRTSNRVPGAIPSAWRTSRGITICPLEEDFTVGIVVTLFHSP